MASTASIRPAKATRPKLRAARFEDYPRIAALESRNGLEPKSYDAWAHLWLANPAWRELKNDWTIGWVVEDGGELVASLGNIPLQYELAGRPLRTVSGRGLVADPAHRNVCMLLLDRLIHQPGADLYLNTTIGPDSASCFSVFECPRVPSGLWDQAAFWITNYRGFCQSALASRNYRFAAPLSYPLSAAAFIKDRFRNHALTDGGVSVQSLACFDDRFDDFWQKLRAAKADKLLAVRTRETLDWHFKHALIEKRIWIAAIADGPRLLAYAIFGRKDNPKLGLRRMRLIDFESLEPEDRLLRPLLSWALRRCRAEGIHLLENIGAWMRDEEVIGASAPHRRKLSTWIYFYRAASPVLAEPLKNPTAWNPTLFDGDATL